MTSRTRWLLATAVAGVAVYALMWVGFASGWPWLTAMDSAALDPAYRYGSMHPAWVTAWDVFCTVLSPNAFRLAGLVVVIIALLRRNWRLVGFVMLTAGLSGPIIELTKHLADRPRPPAALVSAYSMSFPSGHALGVMVGVLVLLAVAWPFVRPPLRWWLVVLGALVVVTVGIGRVVLNVHHPSDIIAGWALGYAYFAVCLAVLPPWVSVTAADETREELDIEP